MKVKREEIIEASEVETAIGKIRELKNGAIQITLEHCRITISKDEIKIVMDVLRPGHDHDDIATIKIKGLHFCTCECGTILNKKPVIQLPKRWLPEIEDITRLLNHVLWGLEEKYGKKFGYSDLRKIARLLKPENTNPEYGELVIHAYNIQDPYRHKHCVDIIASPENLELILPTLEFKEVKEIKPKK